jgi:hypothetical protein
VRVVDDDVPALRPVLDGTLGEVGRRAEEAVGEESVLEGLVAADERAVGHGEDPAGAVATAADAAVRAAAPAVELGAEVGLEAAEGVEVEGPRRGAGAAGELGGAAERLGRAPPVRPLEEGRVVEEGGDGDGDGVAAELPEIDADVRADVEEQGPTGLVGQLVDALEIGGEAGREQATGRAEPGEHLLIARLVEHPGVQALAGAGVAVPEDELAEAVRGKEAGRSAAVRDRSCEEHHVRPSNGPEIPCTRVQVQEVRRGSVKTCPTCLRTIEYYVNLKAANI